MLSAPAAIPRHDRGQLRRRVRRARLDPLTREDDVLVQQIAQAGLLRQLHHRVSPAAEIRLVSSNTALSAVQAWDPCTESALLNCADQVIANPIIPGQKALSLCLRRSSPTLIHGSRLRRG